MANFTDKTITLKELCAGYAYSEDDTIWAYNHKLNVRPAYQRNFIYEAKEQEEVIQTILKGGPLGNMWWAKNSDGTYELLDGQQRTMSMCMFLDGKFAITDQNKNQKKYSNFAEGSPTKTKIDNYKIHINVFEGTEEEKLDWFGIINISNKPLTAQELRNAVYTGTWLTEAKKYFSKEGGAAAKVGDGFVTGKPKRQELLQTAIEWRMNSKNVSDITAYMGAHQHDANADDLISYYKKVLEWAKQYFDREPKITANQNWGQLYAKYSKKEFNTETIRADYKTLLKDKEVQKSSGIVEYLLAGKTHDAERYLNLRLFDDDDKLQKYEEQQHMCPICIANGCNTKYELEDMDADHIIPWSKGGKTEPKNLQMLCRKHNQCKSAK